MYVKRSAPLSEPGVNSERAEPHRTCQKKELDKTIAWNLKHSRIKMVVSIG